MLFETYVLLILNLVLLLFTIILAFIYMMPVLFIRQYHNAANVLTGNVCLSTIVCCSYWLIYHILNAFYFSIFQKLQYIRFLFEYLSTMVNCLVVYSLIIITIDRYCIVIYPHKRIFKQVKWSYILASVQWLIAIIFSSPSLIKRSLWLDIYRLCFIVGIPSILKIVLNLVIFYSVHKSTRRIHAASESIINSMTRQNHHGRDMRLLKHIIFVFIIFIGGWAPYYLDLLIDFTSAETSWHLLFFEFLMILSLLISIIDLFLYNHELRQHVSRSLMKIFRLN